MGKGQTIAGQHAVPTAVGDPLSQHPIEQQATRCGEQSGARTSGGRQRAALSPGTRILHIAAGIAKALRPEIIRYALRGQLLQTRLEQNPVGLKVRQVNNKMVGTMGATLQFAAVPPDFDALQVGAPERAEIRISAPRQLQLNHCRVTALRSLRPA